MSRAATLACKSSRIAWASTLHSVVTEVDYPTHLLAVRVATAETTASCLRCPDVRSCLSGWVAWSTANGVLTEGKGVQINDPARFDAPSSVKNTPKG